MATYSPAACEGDHIGKIGHSRGPMQFSAAQRDFCCPACGFKATEEAVRQAVPVPYRQSGVLVAVALQSLLDYRIVVIFGRHGPTVEYPRPSLDTVTGR